MLPASLVTPLHSPYQNTMVAYEITLEDGSNSGLKKTVVYEEFILKSLEHLEAKNSEVKEILKL